MKKGALDLPFYFDATCTTFMIKKKKKQQKINKLFLDN